jgi:hypothetical protein
MTHLQISANFQVLAFDRRLPITVAVIKTITQHANNMVLTTRNVMRKIWAQRLQRLILIPLATGYNKKLLKAASATGMVF